MLSLLPEAAKKHFTLNKATLLLALCFELPPCCLIEIHTNKTLSPPDYNTAGIHQGSFALVCHIQAVLCPHLRIVAIFVPDIPVPSEAAAYTANPVEHSHHATTLSSNFRGQ